MYTLVIRRDPETDSQMAAQVRGSGARLCNCTAGREGKGREGRGREGATGHTAYLVWWVPVAGKGPDEDMGCWASGEVNGRSITRGGEGEP